MKLVLGAGEVNVWSTFNHFIWWTRRYMKGSSHEIEPGSSVNRNVVIDLFDNEETKR